MKALIVFDDTVKKSEVITDVIGAKGFGQVVVKRQTLLDIFTDTVATMFDDVSVHYISTVYDYNDLKNELEKLSRQDIRVIHYLSNYVISKYDKVKLSFDKLQYIEAPLSVYAIDKLACMMFPSIVSYKDFVEHMIETDAKSVVGLAKTLPDVTDMEGLLDIGQIKDFIQCITGNFDSRYFNSLQGDQYILVKSSTNKAKIKAEYTYWRLLPEDMQFWFVQPFNYQEAEDKASYSMERLHMTDLAIKWVHGSIDDDELFVILHKYFYFFNMRHVKEVSEQEYKRIADELYVNKVVHRVEELKKLPEYEKIASLLKLNNNLTIDELVQQYLRLKDKLESKVVQKPVSVIGHGDPCFANTMYNKSTRTLKFIDPKGAMTEEELWTNPYYDIAKLSHSICGKYDFFNNGLFEIEVNGEFETELKIDFDNTSSVAMFRDKVEENGFDFWLVRLYEASLFLSMLPLHIDNPHKVYGFILNASGILREIEEHV